jgi:hypothetical protein
MRGNHSSITFPKTFSFIEAPNDAINTIWRMVQLVSDEQEDSVSINQDETELIDYGSEAVASVIAKAASEGYSLSLRGSYPRNPELKEVVIAAGMPKHLGVNLPSLPHFTSFDLYHGRRDSKAWGHRSSKKEVVVSDFIRYINGCLNQHGFELNRDGGQYISGIAGEVIDNCEEHTNRDDWWIGGYMRFPESKEYADCHVSIFNFGETIYETISQMADDTKIYSKITRLVKKHSSGSSSLSEQQMWTLYALQQGISRLRGEGKEENRDRGQGTVEMIRFFQELGQTEAVGVEPKMCILSGSTHIIFDGTYMMRKDDSQERPRHIIAFNEANDLNLPPDESKVRQIKGFFPGTVISLKFYLDRRYLDATGQQQ